MSGQNRFAGYLIAATAFGFHYDWPLAAWNTASVLANWQSVPFCSFFQK
jgi:hypothetical protein